MLLPVDYYYDWWDLGSGYAADGISLGVLFYYTKQDLFGFVVTADVDSPNITGRLVCLSGPARCHRLPRYIYVRYGRYLFVDITPLASVDLGITSRPPRFARSKDWVNL